MKRRKFMKGMSMMGLGPALPFALKATTPHNEQGHPEKPGDAPSLIFFKQTDNEFRFLNVLGKVHYKMADLGELLAIRGIVDEGKPGSFIDAYLAFADRCYAQAGESFAGGHPISAREAYLRASTYYFCALEYVDEAGQTGRMLELFRKHRDAWKKAARLMDFRYEEFPIPYEGKTLNGFFMGHRDQSPRSLFILNNGSDGSILDSWYMGGCGAWMRGYNVLTFDGPGQGAMLYEKNLFFRYDWEKVITPVVDSIWNRKDVDRKRIVLLGISQGGYWVPRAVAFEKRIRVAVADPGVTDVSSSWLDHIPPPMVKLLKDGNKDQFNGMLEQGFSQMPGMKAVYDFRSRPYGFNNPFDAYTAAMQYNLNGIVEKITCPMIVTSPDDELFWPGQSKELFDRLQSQKQWLPFTREEGANFHCEPKARLVWEQQVFDRLDTLMK